MFAEDHSSRTEEPSQRRRDAARDEGRVPLSPELVAAAIFAALSFALWNSGPTLGHLLAAACRDCLGHSDLTRWEFTHTLLSARWLVIRAWEFLAIPLLATFVAGFVITLAQVGWHITTQPLALNLDRLSPLNALSRIASSQNLVRSLATIFKSLAALLLISAVAWLWSASPIVPGSSVHAIVHTAWDMICRILLMLSALFLSFGAFDYFLKRRKHEQELRMTREELKQELKEDSGDPQIKNRIRRMQRDVAQQRSLKDVPQATVILTNPTHLAVAIRYDNSLAAPKLLAKGSGIFAKRIVRLAQQHNIPVLERKPLARAIYKSVKVGALIPPELYLAVAQILAFIFRQKRPAA